MLLPDTDTTRCCSICDRPSGYPVVLSIADAKALLEAAGRSPLAGEDAATNVAIGALAEAIRDAIDREAW